MQEINFKLNGKTGVYIITNIENGKKYIGSSINLYDRLNHHIWDLDNNKHVNTHLQNAWNKYGKDSFIFGILEFCSKEIQFEREHFYINTINPEYNFNGVNLESINKHSKTTKLKISESISELYKSGKLKEYLNTTKRHSIPCYIYDIIKWELVKVCNNFAEADTFLQMKQAVRSDLLNIRIFKNKYLVVSTLFTTTEDLKNYVCQNILKYTSKNFKKDVYLICDDGELHYFKTIQNLINYIGCSSKSTISRHLDATIDNPYIIPNTSIKIYFSEKFIPYGRNTKEFVLELSGNIGGQDKKENPEINSETKESESSYSVEGETL